MNERVKILRKNLGLSGEKFGEKLGIQRSAVSKLERGENNLTEQMIKSICREFKVNEEWLRTGEGDMFKKQPLHDEVTEYVANLLEYDGKGNPFYDMIIEMMKTYVELDPPSQRVVQEWFQKTCQNAKAKETASYEPKQDTSIPQGSDIDERMKAYHDYLETHEKATGKLSS